MLTINNTHTRTVIVSLWNIVRRRKVTLLTQITCYLVSWHTTAREHQSCLHCRWHTRLTVLPCHQRTCLSAFLLDTLPQRHRRLARDALPHMLLTDYICQLLQLIWWSHMMLLSWTECSSYSVTAPPGMYSEFLIGGTDPPSKCKTPPTSGFLDVS